MKILNEYAPKLNITQKAIFSSLYQKDSLLYGVCGRKKQIYLFQDAKTDVIPTTHIFRKLLYIPQTNQYLACHATTPLVYILDDGFKEIDVIQINKNKIEDIYFDTTTRIIFVVTVSEIQRYNCNGDYLGVLMKANKRRQYKAICGFDRFLFLAYKKNDCLYIASYTLDGTYIERLSLGCEYAVQNIQIIPYNRCPILRIYTVKNASYPIFIEISPNDTPPTEPALHIKQKDIQIECVSDDKTLQTTAHIETNQKKITK